MTAGAPTRLGSVNGPAPVGGTGPVVPVVPVAAGPNDPLTPAHHAELATAQKRRRKIDRAVAVAAFNGWSTAVFAALTVPFALFSVSALMMTLGLGTVAWGEFTGRTMLRRLDPGSTRRLMWNQIGFAALLIIYSLWQIYTTLAMPSPYAEYLGDPQLAKMIGPIDQMQNTISLMVYGTLIVGSLIFQGGTAVYYHTRRSHLQTYLSQTPAWIIHMQKART